VSAAYVIDATELGDLLPLTGTEYAIGFEAAPTPASPARQPSAARQRAGPVVCFAMDYVDGDQTISKPHNYDFWRAYQPHFWGGPLLGF
jgi:hypothetical protein